MGALVQVGLTAFYALTLAALAFFVHKVLWLVQYRRLQRGLVETAIKRLRDDNLDVLKAWEAFATERWSRALGQPDVTSPSNFIRRVEQWLDRLRDDLAARRSLEQVLEGALEKGEPRVVETVLSLRRLAKGEPERHDVTVTLELPPLAEPFPPDPRLFELDVRSRYGLVRRALVFFSGAADVVMSSQHVAKMSQNVHVPAAVLARRLLLVFVVIGVVVVDWIFGLRAALATAIDGWLYPPSHAGYHALKTAAEKGFFDEHLASILAFGLWMAGYGAMYVALYLTVRRSYQVHKKKLRDMQASQPSILAAIRARQVRELVQWGREYGRSLDGAVGIAVRHAETLLDHCEGRLLRRVAGGALLDGARAIGDALFARLPESLGALEDAPTSHAHSLAHYLWPRVEEMGYQVKLAQYRAAWQHIELAANELRRERPDPHKAHALWRAVVTYATIFAPILPEGTADGLREAYGRMVETTIEATDKDLEELDVRLGELTARLAEQLDIARALVAARVELANQNLKGASHAFAAEVIHVREQARLEAMAFEI
ncbi:MAG TPA: hypothetical protein VHB21_16855 [Minicystis sp.]|nr:hypothetical protein [Minicystis sp.]